MPAIIINHSLVIAFYREVEVTILGWYSYFILRQGAIVTILIVPGISVSFVVTVMSDLEIIEAGKEIVMIDKKDAFLLRGKWIDIVWDL